MPTKPSKAMGALAAALVCVPMLGGCSEEPPPQDAANDRAVEDQSAARLPVIEPPFNRSRILMTVARAASAHSAGLDDADFQRMLDGKQFEVRLRFGCDGQGPLGDHGWSIDPDGRTLRLRVVPTLSLDDEVIGIVAEDGVEAAEGFWLARPWLLQAACPAGQPVVEALPKQGADAEDNAGPPPAEEIAIPRIGIAQFFRAEDSRTGQRIGRPFEAVIQLEEGQRVGSQGFDLILSGRLRSRTDGRVILCEGAGRDRPPDCVVSAAIDRVRIENPGNKATLAEWSL